MALTVAVVKRLSGGNFREVIADITGDSSYATGGEALAAADLNTLMPELGTLAATDSDRIVFFVSERDTSGREMALDRTNDKILFYAAGAEVGAATNLSAVTIRCRIVYAVGAGA